MDYFVRLGLPNKTLEIINRCGLYLQAFSLSHVVAANGQTILSSINEGHHQDTRTSTLLWPTQERPPALEWNVWSTYLAGLERHGRLIISGTLDGCPSPILDRVHGRAIWISLCNKWKHHHSLSASDIKARTRSGPQYWFDTAAGAKTHLLPEGMVPATINYHTRTSGSLASAVFSQNSLPSHSIHTKHSMEEQWTRRYEALLRDEPIPYQEISRSLVNGSLAISVSSSGKKGSDTIYGTWNFHNNNHIYTRSHPLTGGTKYRAELHALWEAIHVLFATERELLGTPSFTWRDKSNRPKAHTTLNFHSDPYGCEGSCAAPLWLHCAKAERKLYMSQGKASVYNPKEWPPQQLA